MVSHCVAQVFAVVSSKPLSQVTQLLISPEHVAQFVLHTSQVLVTELKIVIPLGHEATHVFVDLSKIRGELHFVQIVGFSLQFKQLESHAVQIPLKSTYVSAVQEALH